MNRLGPEPEKLVCQCEWVPADTIPQGLCFQTKAGVISVTWRVHASQLDVRRVITTDGFDSEYGSVLYLPPGELVKPMTYSVPVEEDYLACDARRRLRASAEDP